MKNPTAKSKGDYQPDTMSESPVIKGTGLFKWTLFLTLTLLSIILKM